MTVAADKSAPRAGLVAGASARERRGRAWGLGGAGVLALGVAYLVFGRRVPVTTVPIVRGAVVEAAYAHATVEALDRAVVKAKVGGTVGELVVREGDAVGRGALLARIDAPSLRADLSRARSENWAASQHVQEGPELASLDARAASVASQLASARDEEARARRLVAAQSVATSEVERAAAKVRELESQAAGLEAQKRSVRIDLSARFSGSTAQVDSASARVLDTEVRAPLDGVVLRRMVELGEVVAVNQTLFRVGDTQGLVVECAVDEADIPRVRVGTKGAVTFRAYARRAFAGTVFAVWPDADRERKSFLVKMRLDETPEGLRSGMAAEVNLVLDERQGVLLAPAEAVDRDGFAWVVREGRAEHRRVGVGVRETRAVEIVSGVAEGDRVVVGGIEALREGVRVAASERPSPLAPRGGADGPAR